MIVSKDNAYEFRINARNAGTWDIRLNNASGLIVVIADTRLTLNTWQHIAATWDGTNVTYYLEGVADGGYVLSCPGRLIRIIPISVLAGDHQEATR